jgi:hypothetical protein
MSHAPGQIVQLHLPGQAKPVKGTVLGPAPTEGSLLVRWQKLKNGRFQYWPEGHIATVRIKDLEDPSNINLGWMPAQNPRFLDGFELG